MPLAPRVAPSGRSCLCLVAARRWRVVGGAVACVSSVVPAQAGCPQPLARGLRRALAFQPLWFRRPPGSQRAHHRRRLVRRPAGPPHPRPLRRPLSKPTVLRPRLGFSCSSRLVLTFTGSAGAAGGGVISHGSTLVLCQWKMWVARPGLLFVVLLRGLGARVRRLGRMAAHVYHYIGINTTLGLGESESERACGRASYVRLHCGWAWPAALVFPFWAGVGSDLCDCMTRSGCGMYA